MLMISLSLANVSLSGKHDGYPVCVGIKGSVFDVTGNKAYTEGGYKGKISIIHTLTPPVAYSAHSQRLHLHLEPLLPSPSPLSHIRVHISVYHYVDMPHTVFAGRDASRALAKSSLKSEDCVPEYADLPASELKTLDDWFTFFSKRYNIVGKVEKA